MVTLHKKINISRGIKLGCPLSAIIFILCTQILANAITSNESINGISVPTKLNNELKIFKLSQYADDMSLFLKDGNQLLTALDEVSKFGHVSGLTLNINKTEDLWIGSLWNCNVKIVGIKWPTVIRYLRIHIGYDKNRCKILNWDN